MTNAELIAALLYCKEHDQCDDDASAECPYKYHWTDGEDCQYWLLADAADALEAAEEIGICKDEKIAYCVAVIDALEDSNDAYIEENERLKKRIAELEAQLPKEGEWIIKPHGTYGQLRAFCSACGKHSGIGGIVSNQKKPYCPNCGAKMRGEQE